MNTRTENYFIMNNLWKKRIESPRGNKNKIYCMLILHLIIPRLQSCSLQTFNYFMLSFPIRSSSWRLHGGSLRILFILQVFFKTSLEVMIRQAILKIKHGAQHMFCFEAFKHSSSCIPKCNPFYLIF